MAIEMLLLLLSPLAGGAVLGALGHHRYAAELNIAFSIVTFGAAARLVARVIDPEIDSEAKEIRFSEVHNSDDLLLPEECEFQMYRILIQRIAYASKVNKDEPHKGRILRGVVAELLGFREQ